MILFIDTHDELITIALKNNEELFVKTKVSEYAHSVYTMPMIEEIFKENNLNISINTISSLTAYLVSNETNDNKKAVIEDNKGYYVSVFDKDNNPVVEETYCEEDTYDYPLVEEKLDIEKIIDYCKDMKSENAHFVKANYIKKIEVEK